ncbi:MAG: hypothetical protein CBC49_010655 [Alphaproteobacteria bacterium TMED89]|nr:hypothetical protein [Rhodospirillaceae bacterium]RPH10377.1 MAG: hypothetical protein CBC49_010655 [Alphaproteobacteria bacterium TMED89]
MKRATQVGCAWAAGIIMFLGGVVHAHPYTSWQEDGLSSDAHTHLNSGDYNFAGNAAAVNGLTQDSKVVAGATYGYYLSDGTFVQGRYVEGSVFSGGTVEGNTIVTGGGIISLYDYEETRTTVTKTAAGNSVQASLQLASQGPSGAVTIQTNGGLPTCWCAFSADGEKVPVFSKASMNATVPKHYVGGGPKTFDVTTYYKGFWKVSWRKPDGGIQYGWVREDRVACKPAPRR